VDASGRVLVFNGLGSQGFSVGPWLARALADHIETGAPLPDDVLPARFPPRTISTGATTWNATDCVRETAARILAPGDLAIDLTAGNGGDTLWLAEAVGPEGTVLGLDIQPEAVEATRRRLERAQPEAVIDLRCADHANLGALVPPDWTGRVGAVVAHLGRLSGATSALAAARHDLAAFTGGAAACCVWAALLAVVHTGQHNGADEQAAIERWPPRSTRATSK
jgi:hypothetical protein